MEYTIILISLSIFTFFSFFFIQSGRRRTGRRMCPGLPLAHRMLHLMLGSLIYKFDWKAEEGRMDMSDKFGFTLQKKLPLMAIPVKL
ncbi:cytochrome P450 [Cynara cardunculus var. scolymus]|uniref:Cytochrome P450 n=1 Tax=Cynara cardunculus var. scolymus TaxID=59895 RepID=A0A103XUP1_CYNCS|nr:cytochrome P450 [Cynara cardunculus var. scolymus]